MKMYMHLDQMTDLVEVAVVLHGNLADQLEYFQPM